MNAPDFWNTKNVISRLLEPFGVLYASIATIRRCLTKAKKVNAKVICIGNLTAGGTGKTPVCIEIASKLKQMNKTPHFLTRGYGGKLKNITVDLKKHSSFQTGDEPLLLANSCPVQIYPDRIKGAEKAIKNGADYIIMDDGFQNPKLYKDLSFIVVDGVVGFGNCKPIPAGPLRENLNSGLKRADALIIIGNDNYNIKKFAKENFNLPTLQASIIPSCDVSYLAGQNVVAFAGIGRPEKFFETLKMIGCNLVSTHRFADHYPYAPSDIEPILQEAYNLNAITVTTAKDAVRLEADQRQQVDIIDIKIKFNDETKLNNILNKVL
jgi:tetraacyldisaccharide 4'-kinase